MRDRAIEKSAQEAKVCEETGHAPREGMLDKHIVGLIPRRFIERDP